MDTQIKKVAAVLAVLLIVVLGLIAITQFSAKDDAAATIPQEQTEATPQPGAQQEPADEADAGGAGDAAQASEEETQELMYEGALAGLSDDEIAQMAMQEEQSSARTDTTGTEDSVD